MSRHRNSYPINQAFSAKLAVIAIAFAVVACSGPPVVPAPPISGDLAQCAVRVGEVPRGNEPTVDLSGTWAQMTERTSMSSAPFVGDIATTVTSISVLRVVQTGSEAAFEIEVCSIDTESDNESVVSEIPEAYVTSQPVMQRRASLAQTGNGLVVFAGDHVQVRGVHLDDPLVDLLPDDEDDTRVVDPDGDGHPGLTIRVQGLVDGEMYVVQRMHTALCGFSPDGDRLDGFLEWSLEQVTLDASSFMLDRQNELTPHPDHRLHTFRTTRVEADTTCDQIVEQSEVLFAR